MKRIILLILTLAMLFLCACGGGNTTDTDTTAPDGTGEQSDSTGDSAEPEWTLTEEQLSEYKIVYAKSTDSRIEAVAKLVGAKTGKTPVPDTESETDKEILIGNTNRKESSEAAKALSGATEKTAYAIQAVGDKITICGNSYDSVIYGVKYFIGTFLDGTGETIDSNYSRGYKTDNKVTVYDNLTVLEITTPVQIFGPTKTANQDKNVATPRIVRMEHSEKYYGTLIATQEAATASTVSSYIISKSTDDGATWKQINVLSYKGHAGMYANWQPFLYELPEQIGDMPKGTLLLAGCTHNWGDSSPNHAKTYICLYKSSDCGMSWTHISDIASSYLEGYEYDNASDIEIGNGVWEPVLTVDNGKLLCFYSDENQRAEHSQRLVYKASSDGITWGNAVEVVALESQSLRPGMLSFVKMNNGKYLATHEIVGLSGGPIYYRIFNSPTDWGDVTSLGKQIMTKDRKTFGTSPYVGYSPVGETGMIFVSAEHMITGDDGKGVYIFASFDYGETWFTIENPMPYETVAQQSGAAGYSSNFFTSDDGHTVYFVQATDWDYPEYGKKTVNKMVKFCVW